MARPFLGRNAPLSLIMVEGSLFQTHKLRIRLLKEGLKEHKCENCNLTEWMGEPIPLELSHKMVLTMIIDLKI